MIMKPTYDLCASFGHNFVREKSSDEFTDRLRCKQCCTEVTLDNNGDIENLEESKLAMHQIMKKLFLLRNKRINSSQRQVFSI